MKYLTATLLLLNFIATNFAQQNAVDNSPKKSELQKSNSENNSNSKNSQINQNKIENRDNIGHKRGFFLFKAERTKEQENRLKPDSEDLLKYSQFLKMPKTGIFRLANDLDCDSNVLVIRVDESCRNNIPGGSYYSFREKEYTTAYLADIRFKQGLLISDGVLSQNMLVKLGDLPIESLELSSDGIKFLNEFTPREVNTEAIGQYLEIVRGIKIDKFEYRKVLPAFENTTYAMRIIAYRGNFYRSFRGWFYNLLEGDSRSDLILVFRVIRKDENGSVTLLWRELSRKKSPKLRVEKKKVDKPLPTSVFSNKTIAGN